MIAVQVNGKGIRVDIVRQLVSDAIKQRYPEAQVSVLRQDPPESRAERFSAAISQVEDAKGEIEQLRDELQEWHDNLPENLQSSEKADALDTAVSELDDLSSTLDDVIGREVEFPGMMG